MSTSIGQPTHASEWKQEVNRRLAAHKSRRGHSPADPDDAYAPRPMGTSRAALAVARVAARYAKAPTFSEMQAAEAHTAIRAAEIATQVAIEAQAAARAALANYRATVTDQTSRPLQAPPIATPVQPSVQRALCQPAPNHAPEFVFAPSSATPQHAEHAPRQDAEAADEPRPALVLPEQTHEQQREADQADAHAWFEAEENLAEDELAEVLHPHANLIEFPRELVLPQRIRPRAPEGILAAVAAEGLLSIFEVDPHAVRAQQQAAEEIEEQQAERPTPWAAMELEAEPLHEAEPVSQLEEAPAPRQPLPLAPFSRRVLATVVDNALIACTFLAAATVALACMDSMPDVATLTWAVPAALALTGLLYHAFFWTLSDATPGMNYACIFVCTFDNRHPSRAQLQGRLMALLLSLLPAGLGLAWALFDKEHLAWHDRLSRTYQRRRPLGALSI